MKIKIYIAYHKKSYLVNNNIFCPIQVGKDNAKEDLSIQSDNLGLNISSKNSIYSELTGLYWAWKNDLNSEYIGLCHYRRFFTFDESIINNYKNKIKKIVFKFINSKLDIAIWTKKIIKNESELSVLINSFSNELKNEIEENRVDIFALKPTFFVNKKIKDLFYEPAGKFPIDLLLEIVKNKYPQYFESLQNTINGSEIYYANMTIMKRQNFEEYCNFIFNVLLEHEKLSIEHGWCNDVLKEKCYFRLSGYLGELLTSSYISYKINRNRDKVKLLTMVSYED